MVVARAMAMLSSTVTSGKAVTRARRGIRAGRRSVRVAGGEEGASTVNPDLGVSCSIDDPSTCSLADLELMYVDALWNYYNGGKFTLNDEDYDRLREELNWQGSGFPTLRRYEIEFVQAAISYSRGDPIVDDEKYEELKQRVKAEGKRTDVTALLLFVKGKELLDESEFCSEFKIMDQNRKIIDLNTALELEFNLPEEEKEEVEVEATADDIQRDMRVLHRIMCMIAEKAGITKAELQAAENLD